MIFYGWDKVAYMVQLLVACMIFMIPARKRTYFYLRIGIAGAVLVGMAFFLNSSYVQQEFNAITLLYWAFYILMCVLFIYIGMEGSLKQALYCAICACAMQHIAFDVYLIYQIAGGNNVVICILLYVLIYALYYYFFARSLTENGAFSFHMSNIFPILTIIVLVWIFSIMEDSRLSIFMAATGHRVIYRLIDAICCFYVLWVQINQKKNYELRHELESMDYLLNQQKKQYELTSESIGNINRKCHDLKYQIKMLRRMTDEQERDEFLHSLESDIMIYDTFTKTGNQALDIVLMEKGLFCKNHGIQLTCMADGFQLDFIKHEDIYTIFGNAFDNAITAVMELLETEKRLISVTMKHQNHLLNFQIRNYFQGELEFKDGLPKTTQKNALEHGYGMKSIQYNAEKYNGTITANVEEDIFILQILIPVLSIL